MVLLFACDVCQEPFDGSYMGFWKEKFGKPVDLVFVHYKCEPIFRVHNPGDWFSRGYPGVDLSLMTSK